MTSRPKRACSVRHGEILQDDTAPAATAAMSAIGVEIKSATQDMNDAVEKLPDTSDLQPADALRVARGFADEIAAIWDRSADQLESLVNDGYAPAVLAVEADISALLRSHRRAGGNNRSGGLL